ncbi:MAG: hypothetical protein KKF65_04050, partial [Nanoarchaeota archaeon]|nr:hypothetical protein [Nanoarchaeota archaeon]
TLEAETSIQTLGGCLYGETVANKNFDKIINNKIYSVELGKLEEKKYSYIISCNSGDKKKEYKFTVDRTPPINLSINIQNPTCSLSIIKGTFDAEDNLSGVDYYNYSIMKGSKILAKGSTKEEFSENLNLDEKETYSVSVIAYDKAENYAEAQATVIAKGSNNTECDFKKPTTKIELVPTSEGTLVNINCVDSESGCKNTFDYGFFDETTCSYNKFGNLDTGILLTESKKICWIVYDYNNNNASGEEFVEYKTAEQTYPAYCFNDKTDYDETDVDCGGSCAPCEGTASCMKNEDCLSKSCDLITKTCGIPACNNEFKDGLETDIDCGGICSKCEFGMICENSNDCLTTVCRNNVCSEDLNLDSDKDGMPDYWETQYGLNINYPEDAKNDNDSDGFTNLDEFLAGTNPLDNSSHPPEEKEPNLPINNSKNKGISLTFILIGLILVVAGSIFLFIEKRKRQKLEPRLIDEKGSQPIIDELNKNYKTNKLNEYQELAKKRVDERKDKRKQILETFDTSASDKELKINELKEEKEHDKSEVLKEQKPKEQEKQSDKKDEYVNISELTKDKGLEESDVGKNIFQELELLKRESEKEEELDQDEISEKKKDKNNNIENAEKNT